MSEYSPLETLEVRNFMSYEHQVVSYDEKNIINFKGYNDSGKSAMLKAAAVLMMDAHSTKAAKFVRDGCDKFHIKATFADGVSIIKEKYAKGPTMYEMYKGGKCLFSNRQADGRTLARLTGIPPIIADYLGMVDTDEGYLNYRINTDQQLLVDTPGSANFRFLNQVLQSDEIAGASVKINKDRNALNGSITSTEIDISRAEAIRDSTLKVDAAFIALLEAENLFVSDKETVVALLQSQIRTVDELEAVPEDFILDQINTVELESLSHIRGTVEQIESLHEIPIVPVVDSSMVDFFQTVTQGIEELSLIQEIPVLDVVHTEHLEVLSSLYAATETLKALEEGTIPILEVVEVEKLEALSHIRVQAQAVLDLDAESLEIIDEANKLRQYQQKIIDAAKTAGLSVVTCKGCGEISLVDGEGHTHA